MRMIAEILGCPFHLNILDNPSEMNYIKAEEHQEAKVQTEVPASAAVAVEEEPEPVKSAPERDITIGELVDIHEELDAMMTEAPAEEEAYAGEEPAEAYMEEETYTGEEPAVEYAAEETEEAEEAPAEEPAAEQPVEEPVKEMSVMAAKEERKEKKHSWRDYLLRRKKKAEEQPVETQPEEPAAEESTGEEAVYQEPAGEEAAAEESSYEEPVYEQAAYEEPAEEYVQEAEEEDLEKGDVNPYTGREYKSNSVRMHPTRIGYVQVYDRGNHQWTDMTEWAFLGYQERKKALLGKDYEPPIYLD